MLYRLILIICLSLASGTSLMAEATEVTDVAEKRSMKKVAKKSGKKIISKSTAINNAKSEVNGKVLSVRLIDSRGPAIYRIKMLVGESRVRTVFVDGINGKVIRIN